MVDKKKAVKSYELNFTAEIIMIFFIIHFSFLKRMGFREGKIFFLLIKKKVFPSLKKNTLISIVKFNVLKIVIAKTAERFRVPRCESRQELS